MLSLQKPSPDTIRRFLTAQAASEFTYSAVGATAGHPPAGFLVAHTRTKLGEGKKTFQIARAGWSGGNNSTPAGWRRIRRKCEFMQAKSWQC